VNKKKLPRAIRPDAADTSGADPARSVAEPKRPASARRDPGGRSEANAAEPRKVGSTAAKEAAPYATEALAARRRGIAVKLVERFSLWSAAAGLIPLPFVDLAAVGGVQIQMLRRISQIYDIPFSENRGKALIAGVVGSMIPATSVIGAASMVKSVPMIGTAVSVISMPALSAGATYAIGMAFIQHFASGGTLLDFNPADYREFLKAQKRSRSTRS
jgi:uncharacterized protein (DUF697 family)